MPDPRKSPPTLLGFVGGGNFSVAGDDPHAGRMQPAGGPPVMRTWWELSQGGS